MARKKKIARGERLKEALGSLSRIERFMATAATMNALLILKRVYSPAEFAEHFCQWAESQKCRAKKDRDN